jgi:uncharacterized protein (DUF983 family)
VNIVEIFALMNFWRSVRSLIARRCPVCGQGRVFRGPVSMNINCPVCGLRFEREPGYFVGSMYVSYFFAIVVLLSLTFLGYFFWPDVDFGWLALGAIVLFIPLVPLTTQYARLVWIYLDRLIWPAHPGVRE